MTITAAKPSGVITHTMHVKPMVKKYLQYWTPGVYAANQDELIGMWLINSLTRKTKQTTGYSTENLVSRRGNPMTRHDALKNGYLHLWQFTVPRRYQENVMMPRRRVVQFNNLIMKFVYAEIFQRMEYFRQQGSLFYIQEEINEFRAKYRINDNEFSDERVRKAYLRFRKKSKTSGSEFAEFLPGMLLKN